MALQEGYSTTRPPLFSGEDFGYWKGRMESYLQTEFDVWMITKTGLEIPTDGAGMPLPFEKWDANIIKRVEANAKATYTLQCGLTNKELNRAGPFSSARELWENLIELHEGMSNTSKHDLNDLFELDEQNLSLIHI